MQPSTDSGVPPGWVPVPRTVAYTGVGKFAYTDPSRYTNGLKPVVRENTAPENLETGQEKPEAETLYVPWSRHSKDFMKLLGEYEQAKRNRNVALANYRISQSIHPEAPADIARVISKKPKTKLVDGVSNGYRYSYRQLSTLARIEEKYRNESDRIFEGALKLLERDRTDLLVNDIAEKIIAGLQKEDPTYMDIVKRRAEKIGLDISRNPAKYGLPDTRDRYKPKGKPVKWDRERALALKQYVEPIGNSIEPDRELTREEWAVLRGAMTESARGIIDSIPIFSRKNKKKDIVRKSVEKVGLGLTPEDMIFLDEYLRNGQEYPPEKILPPLSSMSSCERQQFKILLGYARVFDSLGLNNASIYGIMTALKADELEKNDFLRKFGNKSEESVGDMIRGELKRLISKYPTSTTKPSETSINLEI